MIPWCNKELWRVPPCVLIDMMNICTQGAIGQRSLLSTLLMFVRKHVDVNWFIESTFTLSRCMYCICKLISYKVAFNLINELSEPWQERSLKRLPVPAYSRFLYLQRSSLRGLKVEWIVKLTWLLFFASVPPVIQKKTLKNNLTSN